MTTIQDKVTYADGSVASGKIILTWPPFQYGGVAVAAGQQEYPIAPDGTVTIVCYPCVGSQPQGVYFTATYELDKGSVYDECWLVPDTNVATIGSVRAQAPATPSIMINAQQLTASGAQSGMFLGWSGSNWVPMYVSNFNCAVRSFFGRTGDVMPAKGDYTVDMIPGALADPTTTLGDLIVRGSAAVVRLGVGSDGQVLTADHTQTLGVKWAAQAGGVPPTRQILTPPGSGLTGGGPLSSDLTLSQVPNSTNQQVQVASGGTLVGTRHEINFIAGPGTIVNVGDDGTDDRVNVTVSLSGTGPASPSIYAVNGNYIGTEPELNLIAGANTTISGVDNGTNSRVDITVQATGGTSYWQPGTGGVIYYSGGNVGIGTSLPGVGAPNPARTYLSICGSTGLGVLEFLTNLADGDGAGVGQIAWTDKNSTAGDKRISLLYAFLSGPTANNRGGAMAFYTKADGGSSTERMRLDNTGRLGIGTTVPAYTLDIAGDCNITGVYRVNGTPLATGGYWQGGSGGAIYYNGGNVGIGTASPQQQLHIAGGQSGGGNFFSVFIDPNSTNGSSAPGLVLGKYNGVASILTFAGGNLALAPSGGYVGAGTTAPVRPLDVAGMLHMRGAIEFTDNTSSTSTVSGYVGDTHQVTGANSGDLSVDSMANLRLGAGNAERVTILTGGNVGIGTASPAAALQVKAAANEDLLVGPAVSVSNAVCLSAINDGNSANVPLEIRSSLTSFSSGFVGIGATNPSQLLTVVGSPNILASFNGNGSGNTAIAVNSGGGHNCSYCWQNAGASQWYLGNISSNNSLALLNSDVNSNAQVLTILQNGNVGIGTTNPGARLDVAGAIVLSAAATGSSAQFWIGQGSAIGSATLALYAPTGSAIEFGVANSFKMVLTAAGRLGIGTVSPGQPLTVQADASANAIQLIGRASDNVAGIGFFNSAQSAAMYIYSNAAGIGINTSTPAAVLDVAGQIRSSTGGYKFPDGTVQTTAASGTGSQWVNDSNGINYANHVGIGLASGPNAQLWLSTDNAYKSATSTWMITASDAQLKRDVRPMVEDSVDLLGRLNWVSWRYNGLAGTTDGEPAIGLVAQELAQVIPQAVGSAPRKLRPEDQAETELLGIHYHYIFLHAARAIAQLAKRIEELEKRRN